MGRALHAFPCAALLGAVLAGGACGGAGEPGPCPEEYWLDEDGLCRLVEPSSPDDENWPWGEVEGPCADDLPPQPQLVPSPLCTSTYPGDFRVASAADMADFCDSYDCVAGGVDIGSSETGRGAEEGAETIVDLEPLACLRYARYLFVSEAPNLRAMSLPELRFTGGGLSAISNPSLEEVSLPRLLEVGGDLSFQGNILLSTIEVPSLSEVREFFYIIDNPSLPTSRAVAIRDQVCADRVGGAIAILGNGEGAILHGSVVRDVEGPSGASGELFVTVFRPGIEFPGPEDIAGIFNAELVDLTEEDAAYPYSIGNLEPRQDAPYRIEAFLDADGSGGLGGPTPGDLKSVDLLEVFCPVDDLVELDIVLSEVVQ